MFNFPNCKCIFVDTSFSVVSRPKFGINGSAPGTKVVLACTSSVLKLVQYEKSVPVDMDQTWILFTIFWSAGGRRACVKEIVLKRDAACRQATVHRTKYLVTNGREKML